MLPQAMNAVMPRLTMFENGITAVDTEYVRPQMDAAHIVVSGSLGPHEFAENPGLLSACEGYALLR